MIGNAGQDLTQAGVATLWIVTIPKSDCPMQERKNR